ncbi:hypothetical protein [Undibacterium sp.]|uniref:hypothetical protein n=1 Tax=Undibacterium sp. TaxID=1914977 RepID=UPI0025FC0AF7|nr:hypothetical protein [Undibacterium sp.]
MKPWQSWLVRWNQRPYVHALMRGLAPLAGHPAFPLLGGAMALAATATMSVPLVPVVCALVALHPPRWRAIVFWSVLGSAIGAVLLTFAFAELSLPWLDGKMPELMNSTHWKHLAGWVAQHGWWVLAGIAASPVSQTPALVLAAMLGMPLLDVFIAIALGKSAKYSLVARATQLMSDTETLTEHHSGNTAINNEMDPRR